MLAKGVSKSVIVTFAVGILFGFGLTYMFVFSSVFHIIPQVPATSMVKLGGAYFPASPNSHGDSVNVNGPSRSVAWSDDHSLSHLGNKHFDPGLDYTLAVSTDFD